MKKKMLIAGWLQLSQAERNYMEDELHRLIDEVERKTFIAKLHAARIIYLKTQPDVPTWYRGKSFAN